MAGGEGFDLAEMSLSEYICRHDAKQNPFVALPVFPSRVFRHSMITVNRKTVRTPADLAGKRIGVPLYTMTAAVFQRGMLQHDHGIDLSTVHWVEGRHERTDEPRRPDGDAAVETGRHREEYVGQVHRRFAERGASSTR